MADFSKEEKVLQRDARCFFGLTFSGLSKEQCLYAEFKEWYEKTHTTKCTPYIYQCAQFVWKYYE